MGMAGGFVQTPPADRDKGKERKLEHFTDQNSIQFEYLVLPALEIKNLLTPAVLRSSLPSVLKLSEQESQSVTIEESGYHEKGIGAYLSAQIKKRGVAVPDAFKAPSGTLGTYYKNKLADASTAYITWENMSEEARDVAKTLYEFVLANNRDMVV
jgi:hypothetical protein